MSSCRVGFLGTGLMAANHASRVMKEQAEVVAVCGTDVSKARSFSEAHTGGRAAAYSDVRTMLSKERLDALYVCLPPFAHDGQVEWAASRGVHLFLEKPIALRSEQALSMVRAIQSAGVISQVGYHYRFGSAAMALKEYIDSGKAGVPTLFDARFDCNSLHTPWWRDRSRSGGQVLEQVIHTFDLAMYFLGRPERVSGWASNMGHRHMKDYTVEDTSASAIRFQSGALATIAGSNCAVPMEWNNSVTIVCTKLTAHIRSPHQAEFIFTDSNSPDRLTMSGDDDPYHEETRAFLAAVRGNGPQLCPVEEGYRSLLLVEKVLQSAAADGMPMNYDMTN